MPEKENKRLSRALNITLWIVSVVVAAFVVPFVDIFPSDRSLQAYPDALKPLFFIAFASFVIRGVLGMLLREEKPFEFCSNTAERLPDNQCRGAFRERPGLPAWVMKSSKAYCVRALAYADDNNRNMAVGYGTEAIRACLKCACTVCIRGDIYSRFGELENAIADYTEAIRLEPTDGMIYMRRGLAYQAKGEEDKANADFGKAKELGHTRHESARVGGSSQPKRPLY